MPNQALLITEHPLSDADVDDLRVVGDPGAPVRSFYVVVPQHETASSIAAFLDNSEYLALGGRGTEIAVDHPDVQHDPTEAMQRDAEATLRSVVATLRAAGCKAHGEVTEHSPLDSVHELLDEHPSDEVIVLVRHAGLRGVFHRDLASRLADDLDVPVLTVKSHRDS
jgi:nucleotide-binding universal stress UspA family protein